MAPPTPAVPESTEPDLGSSPSVPSTAETPATRTVSMATLPGVETEYVQIPVEDASKPDGDTPRGPDGKFLPREGAPKGPDAPQEATPAAAETPWTPIDVDGTRFNSREELQQYVRSSAGRDRAAKKIVEQSRQMREALERTQEQLRSYEQARGAAPQAPAPREPEPPEPAEPGPHRLLEGIDWDGMERLPLDSAGIAMRMQHALHVVAENADADVERRVNAALEQRLQPFEEQRLNQQAISHVNRLFQEQAAATDDQGNLLFPELQDAAQVAEMWPEYEKLPPEQQITAAGIELAVLRSRSRRQRVAPTQPPAPKPAAKVVRPPAPEVLSGSGTPRPAPVEPSKSRELAQELRGSGTVRTKSGLSLGFTP